MSRKRLFLPGVILAAGATLCLLSAFIYNLPFVQDHLGWRVSELRARIKYAISPPEEAVFTPNPTVAAIVRETLTSFTPTATPIPDISSTEEIAPTAETTPTTTPTPIPDSVQLDGVTHEYQRWNNCGPANLSMGLSFWDWGGTQYIAAKYLKPNQRDKNVMPYEMAEFVNEETDLRALVRVGGDLESLKRLLAAGFPVIVEKGFEGPGFEGWMGHYELITGYDDSGATLTGQNSYYGPDEKLDWAELEQAWRHFNYVFIVTYPPEREEEVLSALGPLADEQRAVQIAADRASAEIFTFTGRARLFAWFNRGRSLEDLKDFAGAAAAFDEAFAIDAQLARSEPEIRAWRLMWYDTSPYWAYYYTGRYYDVVNLATNTLEAMSEPVLEESYYWRGLALEALGDVAGAIQDFRRALQVHPGWEPAISQLNRLGVQP